MTLTLWKHSRCRLFTTFQYTVTDKYSFYCHRFTILLLDAVCSFFHCSFLCLVNKSELSEVWPRACQTCDWQGSCPSFTAWRSSILGAHSREFSYSCFKVQYVHSYVPSPLKLLITGGKTIMLKNSLSKIVCSSNWCHFFPFPCQWKITFFQYAVLLLNSASVSDQNHKMEQTTGHSLILIFTCSCLF